MYFVSTRYVGIFIAIVVSEPCTQFSFPFPQLERLVRKDKTKFSEIITKRNHV